MGKHQRAREWVVIGRASELPANISDAFDVYVASLPWAGTTALDWSRMPGSRSFNVAERSSEEIYAWAKTTRLANHSHVAVWYSRDEGGIIVAFQEAIAALDELYWDAPGPRFVFGVELNAKAVEPFFEDILQYGFGDCLVATY